MARTKIKDLPKDMTIGREELRNVFGGVLLFPGDQQSGSGDFGSSPDPNLSPGGTGGTVPIAYPNLSTGAKPGGPIISSTDDMNNTESSDDDQSSGSSTSANATVTYTIQL